MEGPDSSAERGGGGVGDGGGGEGVGRGTRQGESVKREKRKTLFGLQLLSSLPFFSPLFLSLPPHALALHAAGCTEMIYLCAGAGRHGKSGPHKGIAVPPWSFL